MLTAFLFRGFFLLLHILFSASLATTTAWHTLQNPFGPKSSGGSGYFSAVFAQDTYMKADRVFAVKCTPQACFLAVILHADSIFY